MSALAITDGRVLALTDGPVSVETVPWVDVGFRGRKQGPGAPEILLA